MPQALREAGSRQPAGGHEARRPWKGTHKAGVATGTQHGPSGNREHQDFENHLHRSVLR